MFTQFSTPRREEPVPVAGSLVSLMTHLALVAVIVGDGSAGAGPTNASSDAAAAADAGRERVHWVGAGGGSGDGAPVQRAPGERLPIAYVVPGSGPLREAPPGTPVPRRRLAHVDANAPIAVRRPETHRLAFLKRNLARLPAPPELDVTLLVSGVVASAPDLTRLVTRPEDFRRMSAAADEAELTARTSVLTPEGPMPAGHVDVLPIALVSNPLPTYPLILAQSRIGGHVLVEFTIDSAGVVDMASLRVLRSTNNLFTEAVRAVIPHLRFLPAQIGQHSVGVRVRQPFEFTVRSEL
jgi:protein TonB